NDDVDLFAIGKRMPVDKRQFIAHHRHTAVRARGRPDTGLEPERDIPDLRLLDVVAADEDPELVAAQRRTNCGLEGVRDGDQDGARRSESPVLVLAVACTDPKTALITDDLPEDFHKMPNDRLTSIVDLDTGLCAFDLGGTVDPDRKADPAASGAVRGEPVHVEHGEVDPRWSADDDGPG